MKQLRALLLLLLAATLLVGCKGHGLPADYEPYLAAVDSVLDQQEYYTKMQEARILALRRQAELTRNDDERYLVWRLLIGTYRSYIADSAMLYLDRSEQLALSLDNPRYLAETLIDQVYIRSAAGDFTSARSYIDRLQATDLTTQERTAYYVECIYYYNHLEDFFHIPFNMQVEQYADSILLLTQAPHDEAYLWARYWKEYLPGRGDTSELRTLIEAVVTQPEAPQSPWYGSLTYALSTLYTQAGDELRSLQWIVRSLINDIEHSNNDSAALYILSRRVRILGDYMRSYRYIQFAIQQQAKFPMRPQSNAFISSMTSIFDAAMDQTSRQIRFRQRAIYCLAGLTLWLLVTIAVLLVLAVLRQRTQRELALRGKQLAQKNAQLDRSLAELQQAQALLHQTNADLQDRNDQIRRMNEQLFSANQAKEEHIAALFVQCSGYITKMEELRKTVSRKLKTHQYDDLLRQAADSDELIAQEVQELYRNFDALFLSIYPDFISDLNTLLRPDEQIPPRPDGTLNTDLRIYALVRLGINNSIQIAQFLHLSPRTVYNARMKMRAKATPSEVDFPERVRRLGAELKPE